MDRMFNAGTLNGHSTGIIIKELARRATAAIYNERFIFKAESKQGYAGHMDDVFTSADTKAQETYLRSLKECFPNCGIIAEEKAFRQEPSNGCRAYFTVDPLDGTKAYTRKQSDGVGTMIALVEGNEVLSAYIGDINTSELYGYRPDSKRVWRISRLDMIEELTYPGGDSIDGCYAFLRDPPERYGQLAQRSLGAFKNYESRGGSIGIWAAQLWKRQGAALFLPAGTETPWDSNPVIGISKKLGYLFLKPNKEKDADAWEVYDPMPVMEVTKRPYDTLIIHRSDWPQLKDYLSS